MMRKHGRVPLGLLGMLGLVLAVELGIARHRLGAFTTDYDWLYRRPGQIAAREAPRRELLFLGDSLMKFGVSPRVVESRIGRRGYNLAIVGAPPSATYVVLRRALDAGARPAAVVVDFKANILAGDHRAALRYLPELFSLREAIELSRTARDASLFGALAAGRLIPSVRERPEIRESVLAALAGKPVAGRDVWRRFRRNEQANAGAVLLDPSVPNRNALAAEAEKAVYFPDTWTRDPVSMTYLRRLFTLARGRKVPVVWLLPPIRPDVQARREALGHDEQYLAMVRRVRADFPEVAVFDGRHAGFEPALYDDQSHLNARGAAVFSTAVADALSAWLAEGTPPVWTALARPSGEAPGPYEDMEQTRIALDRAAVRQ